MEIDYVAIGKRIRKAYYLPSNLAIQMSGRFLSDRVWHCLSYNRPFETRQATVQFPKIYSVCKYFSYRIFFCAPVNDIIMSRGQASDGNSLRCHAALLFWHLAVHHTSKADCLDLPSKPCITAQRH